MKTNLQKYRFSRRTAPALLALLVATCSVTDLFGQARDLSAESFLLDDDGVNLGFNTLRLSVPAGGLTANRTVTFPDADGSIVVTTSPGGLVADQILFGGATGALEQSPDLVWTSASGILDIGSGNMTVAAGTGNTGVAGTFDVGGAATLNGTVNLGDGTGADNVVIEPGTGNVGIGTTSSSNFVEISVADLNGTGAGATAGEEDQALNVLATSTASALRAVASRGRLTDATVSTAGSAGSPRLIMGVNGQGTSAGGEFTSVTGGYFNGTLLSGATDGVQILTGVAADAEIQAGASGLTATQNVIGGRFGSDATNGGSVSALGVLASAIGTHTGSNTGVFGWAANSSPGVDIGVSGVANSDVAQLTTLLGTLTIIGDFSTGLLGHNENDGAGEYALYTTGSKVRLGALAGTGSRLVTADADGVLAAPATPTISDLTLTNDLDVQGTTRLGTGTTVSNSRLIVGDGHVTTQQATAPTAAGDGSNFAAGVTVTAGSTDVAGMVTVTDGGSIGTGVITVTFDAAYATTPIVVITPANLETASSPSFISNVGTGSFDINLATTLGDGTTSYAYTYHVIEID